MTLLGNDFLYPSGRWRNSYWIRQYVRQLITDGPVAVEDEFLYILKYTSAECMNELKTTFDLFYAEAVRTDPIEYVEQSAPPPIVIFAFSHPVPSRIDLN